jgi:hypothetical protein
MVVFPNSRKNVSIWLPIEEGLVHDIFEIFKDAICAMPYSYSNVDIRMMLRTMVRVRSTPLSISLCSLVAICIQTTKNHITRYNEHEGVFTTKLEVSSHTRVADAMGATSRHDAASSSGDKLFRPPNPSSAGRSSCFSSSPGSPLLRSFFFVMTVIHSVGYRQEARSPF